ncbi:hypothetical protein E0Z06_03295 [Rheinheimera sp. D18]|uniref:hypothetical protein n=1 Tax=Rheinheimera sp. D18 TaxID=2545632 RepID=UPI001051C690|nr:hypothetical protein [Rheinheimera sp. D18]QBL08606.1 hypothetical protein E0Z06_03295 [Rheinheimera sp. D18]
MNPKLVFKRVLKSRFIGFFAFVLLTSCQPNTDSQAELIQRALHEPAAAMQLANQRLATAQYNEALYWFRQAALLGNNAALEHALQLQQRVQGRLASAQWLQQQLDANAIAISAVSDAQRAILGLWAEHQPLVSGFKHAQGCQLTLQPVISQQLGADTWQRLLQQWQQDRQLSQLPVCFLSVYTVNSTELACTENSDSLIQCQYNVLNSLVAKGTFSQLLVIAGRGKAGYNNGIVQLPDNASLALLRHEFMHILGFVDEYQLAARNAQQVCQPGVIYPNVIIGNDVTGYLQQWQLTREDITLTAVDSCQVTPLQAYRVVSQANVMRFYELELPDLYFQLAKKAIAQPEQLMPVQYYFAYLARQQQNWPQWQQFMQQASAMGYADATQALAL